MCPYDAKETPYKFLCGKILSGGCAGIVASMIVFPIDNAKT